MLMMLMKFYTLIFVQLEFKKIHWKNLSTIFVPFFLLLLLLFVCFFFFFLLLLRMIMMDIGFRPNQNNENKGEKNHYYY